MGRFARNLIFAMGVVLSIVSASIPAFAEHDATIEWQDQTKKDYREAERLLIIERAPEEALIVSNKLLNGRLNPTERSAVLLLIAAIHINLDDELNAAIAIEESVRAYPPTPNLPHVEPFLRAIELYDAADDHKGVKRIRRLWASLGGDPILLAEQETRWASRPGGHVFAEIGGETPDPLSLAQSPPPPPNLPDGYTGRRSSQTFNVSLSVDVYGQPYDIKSRCDDHALGDAAVRYVSDLTFRVKIERGQKVPRIDLEYPVKFIASDF